MAETISLDFVQRLRDEQKFDSVEDLVVQIHQDIATGTTKFLLKSEYQTLPQDGSYATVS